MVGRTACSSQVSVNIGVEPVCPYGYYDYAPYGCASYGYYGPDWFSNETAFLNRVLLRKNGFPDIFRLGPNRFVAREKADAGIPAQNRVVVAGRS